MLPNDRIWYAIDCSLWYPWEIVWVLIRNANVALRHSDTVCCSISCIFYRERLVVLLVNARILLKLLWHGDILRHFLSHKDFRLNFALIFHPSDVHCPCCFWSGSCLQSRACSSYHPDIDRSFVFLSMQTGVFSLHSSLGPTSQARFQFVLRHESCVWASFIWHYPEVQSFSWAAKWRKHNSGSFLQSACRQHSNRMSNACMFGENQCWGTNLSNREGRGQLCLE